MSASSASGEPSDQERQLVREWDLQGLLVKSFFLESNTSGRIVATGL